MSTPRTEHALHGVWYRGDHGSSIPELCRVLEEELETLTEDVRPLLNRMQSMLADYDEFEVFRERMEEFLTKHPEFKL